MNAQQDNDLNTVDEAIAAIADGEMIVVVDDDDRENEGDLILAASKASPEQIAFMVRHTSGIICTPVTRTDARRLKLDPMVATNDAPLGTAFTISIDYRVGLTTGISAEERCNTVRALANGNTASEDFVRPGHVFPLIAKQGGVLMRSGHTEAAVDLARLAGLPPVGVLAELVNDNGSVKRGDEVASFAREHEFKIISVADLIAHRQKRERLVERTAEFSVDTPIGPAKAISYSTPFDAIQHLALVFGQIGDGEDVLTRLHTEDIVDDVFGRRAALTEVYSRFEAEGRGVLIYLREGAAGVPAASFAEDGDSESDENTQSARSRDREWRDIGLGAQILRDLGVASIELIASRDRHYVGVSGFGIEIKGTGLLDT
jgi:3,4-dihydroxy 2-butanone 4-phosphate synthase/GTP cyclohydrolase II